MGDDTAKEEAVESRRRTSAAPERPNPSGDSGSTTLWLVRHAEVEERYQNVFGGRIDMDLSRRGHEQARALARYLQGKPIDALYASPMRRVHQTVAALRASGAPEPTVLESLREVDFGDWTGLHWNEVHARYGISATAWLDQIECAGIANAECARTLRTRIEPCLRDILRRRSGQGVGLVCHGGVIRVILAILLDLPLPKLASFEIDYASVTQVVWAPGLTRVHLLNFTPWREGLA